MFQPFIPLRLLCVYFFLAVLILECPGQQLSISEEIVYNSLESLVLNGNFTAIIKTERIRYSANLTLQYDPPAGFFAPTSLGLYVRASDPTAIIFYSFDGELPTLSSQTATYDSPYIEIDSIASTSLITSAELRNRTVTIVAVGQRNQFFIRFDTTLLSFSSSNLFILLLMTLLSLSTTSFIDYLLKS